MTTPQSSSSAPSQSLRGCTPHTTGGERPKTPPRTDTPMDTREDSMLEYRRAWRLLEGASAATRQRLLGPSHSTPQDGSSTDPSALTLSTNGKSLFFFLLFSFFKLEY